MFKKNAIQLKLVNVDSTIDVVNDDTPKNSPETRVIEVVKESAKFTILMFVGYKTLDTLSKVAIHVAEAKIK